MNDITINLQERGACISKGIPTPSTRGTLNFQTIQTISQRDKMFIENE